VYICLCRAVNDRTICHAIAEGAHTVEAIGEACGAGTVCGGCHHELELLLAGEPLSLVEVGEATGHRHARSRLRHAHG